MRKSFTNDEHGGVAVMFALCLIVLCGAIGLSIDYGRLVSTRSQMQTMVDAAGLAGAALLSNSKEEAEQAALTFAKQHGLKFADGTMPHVEVKPEGETLTVASRANVPMTFMQVLGFRTIPVEVSSVAAASSNALDIFIVADMSSSMGIGADATERARLKAMTRPYMALDSYFAANHPDGCTFACHTRIGVEPAGSTFRDMAKANRIRLREDVVNDAVDALVDATFSGSSGVVRSGNLNIGVIGFSEGARWLQNLTSDASKIKGAMALFPAADRKSTRADIALPWVKYEIERAKDKKRKQKVVLVTDGVSGDWSKEHWTAYDVALCDAIKATGAELIVVETIYEEEAGDHAYERHVRPIHSDVSPALRSCASPGAHFIASSPAEIAEAFRNVAKKLMEGGVRLTQ